MGEGGLQEFGLKWLDLSAAHKQLANNSNLLRGRIDVLKTSAIKVWIFSICNWFHKYEHKVSRCALVVFYNCN
jgi:hypothetical protein